MSTRLVLLVTVVVWILAIVFLLVVILVSGCVACRFLFLHYLRTAVEPLRLANVLLLWIRQLPISFFLVI